MFKRLENILGKIKCDYADVRYEIKHETIIKQNNEIYEQIGKNSVDGYVIRVLKDGAFSSITFTDFEEVDRAVFKVMENVTILSKEEIETVKLAPTDIVKDEYFPHLEEDPQNISMKEKCDLLDHYIKICRKENKIVTATLDYTELKREKYYLNSEGTQIRENLDTIQLKGMLTSKDGNLTQGLRVGTGGSIGFSCMRNLDQYFEEQSQIVVDMLNAEPLQGGTYDIIVDPSLAGVFIHEAFGHLSEADIILKRPGMLEKMQIGNKIASDILNVIDDATINGQLGFYKYDDEGVAVRPTKLIKDGILKARLHSRKTAYLMNEPITGHSIAEDYRYAPIIRMGCIIIEPGKHSFNQMLKELNNGLYIIGPKGGQTSGDNFTFGALYGYKIKNGKIENMIRDINISGNLYETLNNIKAIANDLAFRKTGGCGKGQINPRSCMGAPHVLIKNCIVGGV